MSTAHPDYAFVLVSNRDEFISRPTLRADWWNAPHEHVLGGRDLQRAEQGTWLGITKQGRIAVLTNFRDPGVEVAKDKSRGGIVNAYLRTAPGAREESEAEFVERLAREVGVHDVGGFTLAFGQLRAAKGSKRPKRTPTANVVSSSNQAHGTHIAASISPPESRALLPETPYIPPFPKPLPTDRSYPGISLVSNRTPIPSTTGPTRAFTLPHILTTAHETHALSNSTFEDKTWPKTIHGSQLIRQALHAHAHRARGDEPSLLARLFEVLSIDLLPQRLEHESWETHAGRMKGSIFIDPERGEIASDQGQTVFDMTSERLSERAYGTMKQTVVLVDHAGHVTFVERTLWEADGRRTPVGEGERRIEFEIEGWWDGVEGEEDVDPDRQGGGGVLAGKEEVDDATAAAAAAAATAAETG